MAEIIITEEEQEAGCTFDYLCSTLSRISLLSCLLLQDFVRVAPDFVAKS